MKLRVTDKLFSLYIRTRDDWTCQRPSCGKYYPPPTQALHNSHFHTRAKETVRFDVDNCIALCYGCHRYLDGHKVEYAEFKIKQLGRTRFDALMIRANQIGKRDDKLQKIRLKKMLENIMSE